MMKTPLGNVNVAVNGSLSFSCTGAYGALPPSDEGGAPKGRRERKTTPQSASLTRGALGAVSASEITEI